MRALPKYVEVNKKRKKLKNDRRSNLNVPLKWVRVVANYFVLSGSETSLFLHPFRLVFKRDRPSFPGISQNKHEKDAATAHSQKCVNTLPWASFYAFVS